MPELCSIESRDFVFVVWTKDLNRNVDRLVRTLEKRGGDCSPSEILFTPFLTSEDNEEIHLHKLSGATPVFFENTQYDIEFIYRPTIARSIGVHIPTIEHSIQSVEDSFHYSRHTGSLRGSFNTGNSVGEFRMVLVYRIADKLMRHSISFDIHPTKMNMQDDFQKISAAIENIYPYWLFTLPNTTSHSLSSDRRLNRSYLLLWLARFEVLQTDLLLGLKTVLATPHGKLVTESRMIRLDRVKSRMTARQEQAAGEYRANGWVHKRLIVNRKYSSVDNPENRFVKHVVGTVIRQLGMVQKAIEINDAAKSGRLSESFVEKLEVWKEDMRTISMHSLFNEVGDLAETGKESLVLQKKAGYSKVYSSWQRLKWSLDILAGENGISLRTMAEMYEVWAFLEVRRILLELGFEDISSKSKMLVQTALSTDMVDGKRGAFRFSRYDGVDVYLSHEPVFSKRSKTVTSLTTTQKPDIYLNVVFPDGQEAAWIFDAKYRIEDNVKENVDLVPDDAINQLHRYRDSLLSGVYSGNAMNSRSRPVFGAYALYPGKFSQLQEANPYQDSIDNAGIGAFSLLPSSDTSGSHWLKVFLSEKLSVSETLSNVELSDRTTLNPIARTGFSGTFVEKYRDLVVVANQLGQGRIDSYVKRFETGLAPFYHMRCIASDRQNIAAIIMQEARFLAVALEGPNGSRIVRHVYPINAVNRVLRSNITAEQAGVFATSFDSEYYWLFNLDRSLEIEKPIEANDDVNFRIVLCGLNDLSEKDHLSELKPRYIGVPLSQ